MKKVLFLINTLRAGGAEKVLVDTVNNLDKSKYHITVQTIFDEGVFKEKLAEHIHYETIVKNKNAFLRKLYSKFLASVVPPQLVYSLFVADKYDVEIAFLEGLPTKILSGSTNRNAMKCAWVHTDLLKHPGSYKVFGTEKREEAAYQHFDKLLCVSEASKSALLLKYSGLKNQINVVYNILDDKMIRELSTEETFLPCKYRPCFVTVGRLSQEKGVERLLKVHNRLIKEGNLHSLLIIGEGDLRKHLEQYIVENELTDTVSLLGFQSNPHKYVSKADCFVCSSYAEGFSTAVSEAVICGTPVISTDVAGSREPYAAPRCSVVVENSEDGLYDAMRDVLTNPQILKKYKENLKECKKYLTTYNLVEMFESEVFG